MKTTHQNTVYPQTVEIPEPLEVHPAIPQDLAAAFLRAADAISANPLVYDGMKDRDIPEPCGCIMSHVAIGIGRSVFSDARAAEKWPEFHFAFSRIYTEAGSKENRHNPQWALARIERFLSTGQ